MLLHGPSQRRRLRTVAALVGILLWGHSHSSFAQPTAASGARGRALCRAADALNLFTITVRHVLRARGSLPDVPIFQIPCDTLAGASDASHRAILVVDKAFASDQDVLQYGYAPLPFSPDTPTALDPDDPFAHLGRLILQPPLRAVPSIWTRDLPDSAQADALRLASAAGAVQAVAGFRSSLCSTDGSRVPDQLLAAAEANSRSSPGYHLYFEAALQEHQAISGQARSLSSLTQAVVQDLSRVVVPELRCDVGNRDRFSLMPFGSGATSLTKTAEHIQNAIAGLRATGRSDLGQLNLARTCALQALREQLRAQRPPACNAADYGLWTRAYAPLLHAAQVKVLETSR